MNRASTPWQSLMSSDVMNYRRIQPHNNPRPRCADVFDRTGLGDYACPNWDCPGAGDDIGDSLDVTCLHTDALTNYAEFGPNGE